MPFDLNLLKKLITTLPINTAPWTSPGGLYFIGADIAPGISYFINDKWMLNTTIGSLNYSINYRRYSEDKFHNFGYSFSSTPINLGVRYLLGGS